MSARENRGWRRLMERIRGRRGTAPPAALPGGGGEEPSVLEEPNVGWLEALAEALGEGEREADLGSDPFWQAIGGLWDSGNELLAAQWIDKFIDAPATRSTTADELRVRLVEMYEERGTLAPAVGHLEALTRTEPHALRAHYLLAEFHRRRGDEVPALRHYEAVLARDVTYPNVRQRVRALKAARGQAATAPQGATVASPESIGAAQGARYHLIRELGHGASGVVYLGRDNELERNVAVKLLHPHLASTKGAEGVARFFAEARIAASLRHPNIIAILDLDEPARRLVMELASGGTLRRIISERGRRPPVSALERHAQILSALSSAHARGVVHRDLKPANLMFRRDPDDPGAEIVLGDFGVAHLPDADGESAEDRVARPAGKQSRARDLVGTLAYMAPEQRRGRAEAGSDLYASAVILFEMMTGRHPWSRQRLLAGDRSPDDFVLAPEDVPELPADVLAAINAHLRGVGHPDVTQRPSTRDALRAARTLRDAAVVGTRR